MTSFRHGDARKGRHAPEYGVWSAMKRRCQNPNTKEFQYYGGRGIRVCDRWQDYKNFIEDMGRRPSPNHTLERVNNDGDYAPNNCIWATRDVQMRNRRPLPRKTHCKFGHPFSGENLYVRPNGIQLCRECHRNRMREVRATRKVSK